MSDPGTAAPRDDLHGARRSTPFSTARVVVSGGALAHGRASGSVRSSDGALALELRLPPELGGDASGPNPEQLSAAALAASLHGELALVARQHLLDPVPITVEATVAVGPDPSADGYLLRAEVKVTWPGIPRVTADRLLARAVARCPYAKPAGGGIPAAVALAPEQRDGDA